MVYSMQKEVSKRTSILFVAVIAKYETDDSKEGLQLETKDHVGAKGGRKNTMSPTESQMNKHKNTTPQTKDPFNPASISKYAKEGQAAQEVVGYGVVQGQYISKLCVPIAHRRKGIGSLLLGM